MHRWRDKRSRCRSILSIGLGLLVLAYAAKEVRPVIYHVERASYHAKLEQAYKTKAKEYQQFSTELAELETKLALQHAQLRQRYRRAAILFWECQSERLPLPYPWNKDRDRQVLEAVLLSFINRPTKSDPASERSKPQIIVDRLTSLGGYEDWYSDNILPSEFLPLDVANDLQRRNEEGPVPLGEFKFLSRQIVLEDFETGGGATIPAGHPDGVGFLRVSLPGYSRDGRIALVAVSFALGQHGGGEVFALVNTSGEWRVAGTERDTRE